MTNSKSKHFSFADHAVNFRKHIKSSIRGYDDTLRPICRDMAHRFAQSGTRVLDVGCSTGHGLAALRRSLQAKRPNVQYVGIDIEPSFAIHWDRLKAKNLHFEAADGLAYEGFTNLSLALMRFTLQFIRPVDKPALLKRVYDGLVEGGTLLIAEKTLADTAKMQDAMAFAYYDYKLKQGFTAEQILDKERSLRGQMTCWSEAELKANLMQAGFRHVETVWKDMLFVAAVAHK
ncbi:methyltransferase [Bradyrhizobium barranii subsp. apii]|uniref:methyltransferase n=1 Tax=Bradyrhizobium barranii TaxID=2992140 RepID=UPI001AA10E54|nr:methyltransferase [Bradyrhizobium barranii]UPT96455.1 methyltransferase [Bradyrhizobium barranii subsp. apii]